MPHWQDCMDVDLKSLNHICVLGRYLANHWSYKALVFDKTLEIFCPRDNMIIWLLHILQPISLSTTFQTCTLWLHSLNLRLSIPHGNTGCRLSSLITLIFFFWLGNPPPSASSWSPIRTNSSLKHLKPFCNVADCICDHNRKQIAHRFRLKILFSVFSFV